MPRISSPNGTLEYGLGHPTALWSDYLRIIEECQKGANKFYTLKEYYTEILKK